MSIVNRDPDEVPPLPLKQRRRRENSAFIRSRLFATNPARRLETTRVSRSSQ